MKQQRPRDYNPLDDARSTLRIILIEAGADGMPSNDIAVELKRRQPEVIPLLTNQLLTDWVRRQLNRMKDRDGLPLYRSVARRHMQRAFWDEAAYREVIDRYVRGSKQNLTATSICPPMAPGEPVPRELLTRTLEDVDPLLRADGLRRLGAVGLVEGGPMVAHAPPARPLCTAGGPGP